MHLKTVSALLGICTGIALSFFTTYSTEFAVAAFLLCIAQTLLYFFERRWQKSEGRNLLRDVLSRISLPVLSSIFFICVALGILRVQFTHEKNVFECAKACEFSAYIVSNPKIQNEYQIFSVRPEGVTDVYDVQVKAPLYPRFYAGDAITLTGSVRAPQSMMTHVGEKSFNYEMYLRVHGIGSEMYYPSITKNSEDDDSYSFVVSLQKLRDYFVSTITNYVDEPASQLASGMLFGNTSMSKELTEVFRVAGLSHIVVLSGFNIVIVISSVLFVLIFLPLTLRIIFAFIFVIFFVLMVGAEASVIRATLMSVIGLTAMLLGRAYVGRQALLLSLLIICLIEPLSLIYDASLHLSFLATAGIIYGSAHVQLFLFKIKSVSYREIIATTMCAYVATLPYIMYTFGTVSLYALLTNLIVLPMVPIMMLTSFLTVLFAPLSHYAGMLFGYASTSIGTVIIFIAELVTDLPLAYSSITISITSMIVLYLILIIFLISFRLRRVDETSETKNDEILSGIISY